MSNYSAPNKVVKYSEVPIGAVFKVLKPETNSAGLEIKNDGTYYREDMSHSVEIHNKKTAIFSQGMPCKIITVRRPSARSIREEL